MSSTNLKQGAKSLPTFQNSLNVEIVNGKTVIKNIVIIQSGIDKSGDFFTKSFIESIVENGNSQPQGVKARFGHPQLCKTTLGSYIGRYKDSKIIFDEKDERFKAVADLHLADISKKTSVEGRDISLHDYVVGLAKEDPSAFGNSIVYSYQWREKQESDDLPEDYEGETVQELSALIASDVVDSPAATTHLFKSDDDLGVQIGEFMNQLSDEHTEQLFEVLENKPEIVSQFLNRFKALKTSNMKKTTIIQTIKSALFGADEEAKKDFTITAADGEVLTVVTEEERTEPQAEDVINDSDGAPVEDGDYLLNDGSTIRVEAGAITAITPAEEEEEEEEKEQSDEAGYEDASEETQKEEEVDLKSYIDTKFKELTDLIGAQAKSHDELAEDVKNTFSLIAKNMKSELDIDKGRKAKKEETDAPADRIVTKRTA